MSEEVSPFGGENLPLKELKIQSMPVAPKIIVPVKKDQTKIMLFALVAIIILLLVVIILLVVSRLQQRQPVLLPSPTAVLFSPSPTATGGALPKTVIERLDTLEKQLTNVDLRQTELSFPLLDFSFNTGKEK